MQQEHSSLGLNMSSQNLQYGTGAVAAQPVSYQPGFINRVKHCYIEEENVYGRFTPFLMIKDRLHSQIDSSGTTALAHMCSHNSPFIPLYLSTLKHGDPILDRPTSLGHTPLDIAGMFCKKQYVDMLKSKGATDDGRVDIWAIQGANYANWSGKIDPAKTKLIIWAAYNDMPQVLQKYAQAGCNMNEPDQSGNTPIDTAVINKCYESVQVLAKLGLRPKETLITNCDSAAIRKIFKDANQTQQSKDLKKNLKILFTPLLLLSHFLVARPSIYLILTCLFFWIWLLVGKTEPDSNQRPTNFHSSLVNKQINYRSNHWKYVSLMTSLVLLHLTLLIILQYDSFALSFYYVFTIFMTCVFGTNLVIMLYGIASNTTPNQMFQSHKHSHLWRKIDYIVPRNFLTRIYKNTYNKDVKSNIKEYMNMH